MIKINSNTMEVKNSGELVGICKAEDDELIFYTNEGEDLASVKLNDLQTAIKELEFEIAEELNVPHFKSGKQLAFTDEKLVKQKRNQQLVNELNGTIKGEINSFIKHQDIQKLTENVVVKVVPYCQSKGLNQVAVMKKVAKILENAIRKHHQETRDAYRQAAVNHLNQMKSGTIQMNPENIWRGFLMFRKTF